MPSARDLLQQADALMRSHRNLGSPNGQETVPVLTDVAIPGGNVVVTRQRIEEIPVLTNVVADEQEPMFDLTIPVEPVRAPHRFPPTQTDALLLPLSEMPPMPPFEEDDSIMAGRKSEKRIDRSPEPAVPFDDAMPKWLEADLLDSDPGHESPSVTDTTAPATERLRWEAMPAPPVDALSANAMPMETVDVAREAVDDTAGGHPSVKVDDVSDKPIPVEVGDTVDNHASVEVDDMVGRPASTDVDDTVDEGETSGELPASPRAVEAAIAPGHERHGDFRNPETHSTPDAGELAETVYFQVLQNLDLYTERALQQHMTAHLSPIIERATQELLATLNANLGALVRQFVADAIEKQLGVRPTADKSASET